MSFSTQDQILLFFMVLIELCQGNSPTEARSYYRDPFESMTTEQWQSTTENNPNEVTTFLELIFGLAFAAFLIAVVIVICKKLMRNPEIRRMIDQFKTEMEFTPVNTTERYPPVPGNSVKEHNNHFQMQGQHNYPTAINHLEMHGHQNYPTTINHLEMPGRQNYPTGINHVEMSGRQNYTTQISYAENQSRQNINTPFKQVEISSQINCSATKNDVTTAARNKDVEIPDQKKEVEIQVQNNTVDLHSRDNVITFNEDLNESDRYNDREISGRRKVLTQNSDGEIRGLHKVSTQNSDGEIPGRHKKSTQVEIEMSEL
ncbi:uncharacterized protein LOC132720810 [Ruditapes philippinarum]|uniref:uncharacterized protein LOC132720810 n=1 Tax=Ruditapes philippinarum TaxID=129788 RepID=UPI00295BA242|nr:uncharacterized protein LOC132720810 [Ruditapes philippinarum]